MLFSDKCKKKREIEPFYNMLPIRNIFEVKNPIHKQCII